MKIEMMISRNAADFIRAHKLKGPAGEPMVVQLFGALDPSPLTQTNFPTLEEAVAAAEKAAGTLYPDVRFRWVIGANYRSAVPEEDIHQVDGIPFHLPEQINAIIGNRTLVLAEGRLEFVPDLPPFSAAAFLSNS